MSQIFPQSRRVPDNIDRCLIIPVFGTIAACVFMAIKGIGFTYESLDKRTYSNLSYRAIPFLGSFYVANDISQARKINLIFEQAWRAEKFQERAVHFASQSKLQARHKDFEKDSWKDSNGRLLTLLTCLEKSLANDAAAHEDKLAQDAAFRALAGVKGQKAFHTSSSAINTSKCISCWRYVKAKAIEYPDIPDIQSALARASNAKEKAFQATKSALIDSMQTLELRVFIKKEDL